MHIGFPYRTEISSFVGSPRVAGITCQKYSKRGPGYSRHSKKRHGPNIFRNRASRDEHTQTSNMRKIQCDLLMIEKIRINVDNYLTLPIL